MKAFPKCWVFPGGMVDKGNDLETEVLRELQEEVGINTCGILKKIEPLVLYGIQYNNYNHIAGDLTDPHGTHRVCLEAIFGALEVLKDEVILTYL